MSVFRRKNCHRSKFALSLRKAKEQRQKRASVTPSSPVWQPLTHRRLPNLEWPSGCYDPSSAHLSLMDDDADSGWDDGSQMQSLNSIAGDRIDLQQGVIVQKEILWPTSVRDSMAGGGEHRGRADRRPKASHRGEADQQPPRQGDHLDHSALSSLSDERSCSQFASLKALPFISQDPNEKCLFYAYDQVP
ncbi:hypothetical protein OESDEN_02075 [Oesophagostomum dentatum]|uniref:Uncharacterized protein n=1 Tax=Oesophagostomum dentatum TaxID=61180 RepID=A0A0B1TRC0_OESDE|nr:hypothetical protein OESDEN_02075 [Oesophagostomum dentatum]